MATGAAAEMMLRCVLDGSLVMKEIEVERRPYHRNCTCALHNLKATVCSSACSRPRTISYSKNNNNWNHCSLSIATSQFSSQSGSLVGSLESNTTMRSYYMDGQN